MTLDDIKHRVEEIRAVIHQRNTSITVLANATAHEKEDDLRRDFIRWLAELPAYRVPAFTTLLMIQAMAGETLKTEDVDFPRHCS